MKSADKIIEHFYSASPELKNILLKHSNQVKDKALQIAAASGIAVDIEIVISGALLHDIGIIRCHAPDICCNGELPYICHGIAGAAMLRELDPALEVFARICERHTGSGLAATEIIAGDLPLPPRDMLPETTEEKLICLADKFFSKSGEMAEKPLAVIQRQSAKFGTASLSRLNTLLQYFNIR